MRLRLMPPVSAGMNRFYFRFVLETFEAPW
jgi:hypothetical protein